MKVVKAPTTITGCVHHWRIAEQCGAHMLPGTCLKCGAAGRFPAAGAELGFASVTIGGKLKYGRPPAAKGAK